ncbi:MAG: hypothetical protein QOJ48_1354 [Frankiales bacterium]|nr:hypothetical protein [Frankiales bacterium]
MHRPRPRVAIPVAAATVLAVAATVFVLTHRDHATPLKPNAAVDKFRAIVGSATASPAAGPRSAPQPGVYSYDTTGFEKTDVLSGARHDYPAISTVTYTPKGCGAEDRWQPLVGRFSANATCRTPAGLELRSTVQHREFFGRLQAQTFTCPAGFVELPIPAHVGQRSQTTCAGTSGSLALTARVLGSSIMHVAGESVEVTHLVLSGRLTGSTTGTISRDLWLAATTGLLVRATATADTRSDTLAGPAKYTERYTVTLKSLAPQR